MNEIFIDSNVILYLMDSAADKQLIAQHLLLLKPSINAQVLTEVANVCKRRFKYDKQGIVNLWSVLLTDCGFVNTSKNTFHKATELVKKYDFQLFDALIVASALEANCRTLYSEDMQHKMIIENQLTIINPFIQ